MKVSCVESALSALDSQDILVNVVVVKAKAKAQFEEGRWYADISRRKLGLSTSPGQQGCFEGPS